MFKKSRQHPERGPATRNALIDQLRENYSMVEICDALELSRSGYYKRLGRLPSQRQSENEQLLKEIKRFMVKALSAPMAARERPWNCTIAGCRVRRTGWLASCPKQE